MGFSLYIGTVISIKTKPISKLKATPEGKKKTYQLIYQNDIQAHISGNIKNIGIYVQNENPSFNASLQLPWGNDNNRRQQILRIMELYCTTPHCIKIIFVMLELLGINFTCKV